VTQRNQKRIFRHVSKTGLFIKHRNMVKSKLRAAANMHFLKLAGIRDRTLGTIEADILFMTDPDTAVLKNILNSESGSKIC
jgi:ABC-type transport system involved in cytochrome c biogenesis ATPase subunit